MSEIVFAYGTLRDKIILEELLGRIPERYPAMLKGFQLSSIQLDGNEYPIIIQNPQSNKTIEGDYFLVNSSELKILDDYETDAYRRIEVLLENGTMAWVYCL
jgi:gamma-glutamylcyclotransferase (GGCT)/AIG2-like uncharacterized protein YtfP